MVQTVYNHLMRYSNLHELNPGLTNDKINEFELTNHIMLPKELRELYLHFDGGELFIPGTTIYGIYDSSIENSIKNRNAKAVRQKMSLTANYLIIAKLNYGDLICVDLNKPNKVIQWSHETDELFCEWDNIDQWLSEMIADYEEYEAGEQS